MAQFNPPRSRVSKLVALSQHAVRAGLASATLAQLAGGSKVARALVAARRSSFAPEEEAVFRRIEDERARLFARTDAYEWRVEDPLDPATVLPPAQQVVGKWARLSSVKPHWGRVLYALTREIAPELVVELGACFGISGLYIQAAMQRTGRGRFVTLEGSRFRGDVTADAFRRHGHDRFEIVVGDFNRTLPPLLARLGKVDLAFIDGNHYKEPTLRYDELVRRHAADDAVIVHDDIRWSPDMEETWAELRTRSATRVFDVFRLGVVELGAMDRRPAQVPAWLGLAHAR